MNPLTLETDPWLRLWTWYHRDGTMNEPAQAPEFGPDPWPLFETPDSSLAPIPEDLVGPWTRSRGRSSTSTVYQSPTQVLRVARSDNHHPVVDLEAMAMSELAGDMAPSLLARGAGWLLRLGLPGTCPDSDGPWVEEMAAFALRLRSRELPFLEPITYPSLELLDLLCGEGVASMLATLCSYPPLRDESALAPSHGDLHAGNILINDTEHLSAVLDFESIALAVPERDAALWITVLAGQVGLDAARRAIDILCPEGVRPMALRAEILRLPMAVVSQAISSGCEERMCTARYMVTRLIDNPDLALHVLSES